MIFDDVLLVSDFDRTFSDHTKDYEEGEDIFKYVPERNVEAINEFVALGGTFAIASGRNPDELLALRKRLKMHDLYVASNGTAVYSASLLRAVVSHTMDERVLTVLGEIFRSGEANFVRLTDGDFRFNYVYKGDDFDAKAASSRFPIYKAIVEFPTPEQTSAARAEISAEYGDEYLIETSEPRILEVCPKSGGKGEAVAEMRELIERERGAKFKSLVCVGDNENDAEMLGLADVGFAVANAVPAAKAAATEVTIVAADGALRAVVDRLKTIFAE